MPLQDELQCTVQIDHRLVDAGEFLFDSIDFPLHGRETFDCFFCFHAGCLLHRQQLGQADAMVTSISLLALQMLIEMNGLKELALRLQVLHRS